MDIGFGFRKEVITIHSFFLHQSMSNIIPARVCADKRPAHSTVTLAAASGILSIFDLL